VTFKDLQQAIQSQAEQIARELNDIIPAIETALSKDRKMEKEREKNTKILLF